MSIALKYLLIGLLVTWFTVVLSIIGLSAYCVIFGYPSWLSRLFQKSSRKTISRFFIILALATGFTALLLSIVNTLANKK